MKKIYISQPMRGRATNDILAERKALIADAAGGVGEGVKRRLYTPDKIIHQIQVDGYCACFGGK